LNVGIDTQIAIFYASPMFDAHPAPNTATAPQDPREARAEERLDMLRELAELGMTLARELTRRVMETPDPSADPEPLADPDRTAARYAALGRREPRHDPAESFARISRAIRLTLALEARAEADLAALRAGEAVAAPAADASPPDAAPARASKAFDEYPYDHGSAHRNRIRDRVYEAINAEITDIYPAQRVLAELYERLAESERYDAVIHRPLKESVAAICEDLGLHPDWSLWTEEGFTPRPDARRYQWQMFWGASTTRPSASRQQ
jgi:hypothetical protein